MQKKLLYFKALKGLVTLLLILSVFNVYGKTPSTTLEPSIVIYRPDYIEPNSTFILRADITDPESADRITKVEWYRLVESGTPGIYDRILLETSLERSFEFEYSTSESEIIEAIPYEDVTPGIPARTIIYFNGENVPMIQVTTETSTYCNNVPIELLATNINGFGKLVGVDWYQLTVVDETHVDRTLLFRSDAATNGAFPYVHTPNGNELIEAIPIYEDGVGTASRIELDPIPWVGALGGITIGNRKIIDNKVLTGELLDNYGEIVLLNHSGTIVGWEYSNNGQVTWSQYGNGTSNFINYEGLQVTTSFRAKVYTINCGVYTYVYSSIATVNISPPLNSITSIIYDQFEKRTAETRIVYDAGSRPMQTLSKDYSNYQRIVSQPLYDAYGHNVGSTLSAPTGFGPLSYQPNFITSGNQPYDYKKFDLDINRENPSLVDATIENSLGYYYSQNNLDEPNIPQTSFPYSRVQYYEDGSGDIKKASQPGESLRFGSGHESFGGTFPVSKELDLYKELRSHFWVESEIGKNEISAVQSVSIDPNGIESVVISDMSGNPLITASYSSVPIGTLTDATILPVSISNYNIEGGRWFYFYATNTTSFYSSQSTYQIYNVITNAVMNNPTSLPKGFYKYICNNNSAISYSKAFENISFYFYNHLNQQIAVVSPEGVKDLLLNYSTFNQIEDVPFASTYKYNIRGLLVKSDDFDAGVTEYVYREDGEIRFSRNAKQLADPDFPFSYVHYDPYGNIIETGEYYPGATSNFGAYYFDRLNMPNVVIEDVNYSYLNYLFNDVEYGWGKDIVAYHYDNIDTRSPQLSGYDQKFVDRNLSWSYSYATGSWTRYNYDEQGRLTWMIIHTSGTGEKTIDYTYNFFGNVSSVGYQKNSTEKYFHHYFFDRNNRLSSVYSGKNSDFDFCDLQAKYVYYNNGMLKRVELGENTQGVDYTYTAQGWLKAINNPQPGNYDPGGDNFANSFRKDAFSMRLEYYPNDYVRTSANLKPMAAISGGVYDKAYYDGTVKNIVWYSNKPSSVISLEGNSILNPMSYVFDYDKKYQMKSASWAVPTFGSNNISQTLNNKFLENNLGYDNSGNILTLNRYSNTGTLNDDFIYNYGSQKTNKLLEVPGYASYEYDQLGQLKEQHNAENDYYLTYNSFGLVSGVYLNLEHTQVLAEYQYNERGHRIRKMEGNNVTLYVPDGSGNVMAVYQETNNILEEIPIYANGRIGKYNPGVSPTTSYELNDHLGNVRVVIDRQSGEILQYNDYYGSGYIARSGGISTYNQDYQGQFADKEDATGWSSFQLRQYDTRIMRWLSIDPYQQYHSPYVGMGNNPINRVDPDGGYDDPDWYVANGDATNTAIWIDGSAYIDGYRNVGGENLAFGVYTINNTTDILAVRGNHLRSAYLSVSFDKGADKPVNPKLVSYFQELMKKASYQGVKSVNISSTTNHPSNKDKSAHSIQNGARAFDINYIDKIHVSLNSKNTLSMQKMIQKTPGWREHYGPFIIQKIENGKVFHAPWARDIKGGHYDHIHVSIPWK